MREIADWVVFLFLGVSGFFDWKKKELPVFLLIIMSVTVIGMTMLSQGLSGWSRLGGAFVGVLLFIISKCTGEAIGYGDSWIILLLGIYMGGFQVLQVLFVASLAAGVCSLFFLWKRHWKKNATLPFVPFLAVAYLGVLVV